MNNSQSIKDRLLEMFETRGLFYTLSDIGEDQDGETAHLVIFPNRNQSLALIECTSDLAKHDVRPVAMHQLSGEFTGCFEIDVVFGHVTIPKHWHVYMDALIEDFDALSQTE